jgi:hypothetical protein
MGILISRIIRLPFYLLGVFLRIPLRLITCGTYILTLPFWGLAMIIVPSISPNKAKDILSFGVL